MADPHVVSTLRRKQDELNALIRSYEKNLEAARHDLAHVNATLRMFELNGEREASQFHMSLIRLFKRWEPYKVCLEALASAPEGLNTRELAVSLIRAKGFDESDAVLRKAVRHRLVLVMKAQERRGHIARV